MYKNLKILCNSINLIYDFQHILKMYSKIITMYKKIVESNKTSRLTHLFAMMHIFKVCDVVSVNSDIARAIAPDYYFTSCRFSIAI